MIVNSKDVDPIYYDPDYHAMIVKDYEDIIALAKEIGDTKLLEETNSQRIFDENGFFIGIGRYREDYPNIEDFLQYKKDGGDDS